MDEYDAAFVKLVEFAPHMVLDERERIQRFIKGIETSCLNKLAARWTFFPLIQSLWTQHDGWRTEPNSERTTTINGSKTRLVSHMAAEGVPHLPDPAGMHFPRLVCSNINPVPQGVKKNLDSLGVGNITSEYVLVRTRP